MRKAFSMTSDESVSVELTLSPSAMSDPTKAAELALANALEYSARKMGLPGQIAVMDRLRAADPEARGYFHYSLAKQVAEYLGDFDHEIKAIYTYDFDATPEDVVFGENPATSPLHLIVWAQRKTEALAALIESLDRALAQCFAKKGNMTHLKYLLDVQVVDDGDVSKRTGYGAMLNSLHQKPLQVWERHS